MDTQISVEDVKTMLGEKDLVIFQLQKEVERLNDQIRRRDDKELEKAHPFHQIKKAEES
jgi:hypothetical protein